MDHLKAMAQQLSRETILLYGHFDDEEARDQVLEYDNRLFPIDHPLVITRGYARWVPDGTGEFKQVMVWSDGPARGAFPCTQVEIKGQDEILKERIAHFFFLGHIEHSTVPLTENE